MSEDIACELFGHVWCSDHNIWHPVYELTHKNLTGCIWEVPCGNCGYDYDDFCKLHNTFMIYGEKPLSKNDPFWEKINEIESTHG